MSIKITDVSHEFNPGTYARRFEWIDEASDIKPEHFVNVADMAFEAAVRGLAAQRDAMIKDLLGRWVSEIEPCIFMQAGTMRILGIGGAGHPGPTILVRYEPRPPHRYPPALDFSLPNGATIHLELP